LRSSTQRLLWQGAKVRPRVRPAEARRRVVRRRRGRREEGGWLAMGSRLCVKGFAEGAK